MNRVVSFTNEGDIRVESESVGRDVRTIDVIRSGVVLLTLKQAEIAKLYGWKMDVYPFTKETTPWLYSVRRP
jgi:hypothetical protein